MHDFFAEPPLVTVTPLTQVAIKLDSNIHGAHMLRSIFQSSGRHPFTVQALGTTAWIESATC